MMDRLSNPAKLRANALAKELKVIMTDLYRKHMDDIISGEFSSTMMKDWANDDVNLLKWRKETGIFIVNIWTISFLVNSHQP